MIITAENVTLAGIAVKVADAVTDQSSDRSGGVFFGPDGLTSSIDAALPKAKVPGTEISLINTSDWLIAIGAVWLAIKAVTR